MGSIIGKKHFLHNKDTWKGIQMEELSFINVKHDRKCKKEVKKLYQEAFPKEEKMPFWLLCLLDKENTTQFYGIYDKEQFVGLVYNVYYQDIVFIFYLAINPKLRGQGYGSRVLKALQEKYLQYRMVLNIEQVDEKSSNYQQRLKRRKFYENNGFSGLNYTITEMGVVYEMMGYDKQNKPVTKEEYMALMENYFGKFLFQYGYRKICEI